MSEVLSFIDVLRREVAAMQAVMPDHAGAISRAHALIINGCVKDRGDGTADVLASDLNTWHHVNGVCDCQAAAHGKRCKHADAWRLYQDVQQQYEAQLPKTDQPPMLPIDDTEKVDVPSTIPRQFITMIQGKPFVQYQGLLAMAHEHGLMTLSAKIEQYTDQYALASASASFQDGRTFAEWGDATPANVNKKVAPHYARVALTRAKSRALRDALNVGIAAVEELEH